MKRKTLGKSNLEVSQIGHGTWGMGGMWGPRDDRGAIEALKAGFELGINFVDTATVYGNGHSEELIAVALKESKAKGIQVASKVPPKNYQWPGRSADVREAFPADWIIENTEASLKRLRREQLELQQLHVWHDGWLDQGDWQEAVAKLKEQGKIQSFGVSINDHDPESALKIVESGIVDVVQVIYNIFDQRPEEKLFPLCLKNDVGVIVRVPFDEGSLTGRLKQGMTFHKKDWRKNYFTPEHLQETLSRVEALKHELKEGESLSDLALKFCLAHPAVSTVIPGMRSIPNVKKNGAVLDQEPLSLARLEALRSHAWPRNFYPSHG